MSSFGTLCSDWLQLVWWAKTPVSCYPPHCCPCPRTAPGGHCRRWSCAGACGHGWWTCVRDGCCCSGSRRRCRCRLTRPCLEGRGRGQRSRRGNPRLLARLLLLRRTSARRCGCWRRCWTACCCWSGWSTECHPAGDNSGTLRHRRRWSFNI